MTHHLLRAAMGRGMVRSNLNADHREYPGRNY
jgi:hypothetical protein